METVVERFAEGLGAITATASVQLVTSMRCVVETLYLLDIFGEHQSLVASPFTVVDGGCSCTGTEQFALSRVSAPRLVAASLLD